MEWKQREILFRGIRQDTKECVYGFLQNQHCIYSYTSGVKNGDFYMIFPGTAVQYTGVKDINGKKIFEGDIIKCIPSGAPLTGGIEYKIIKYSVDVGFGMMPGWTDYEILGNVFQNLELVEKYELEVGE